MKGTLGAAAILLAAMSSSLTAQQHFPTNEDLRQLRAFSSPQLSPDLKHVVVTVQDSTADGGRTHLWLLSTDGSPYRQLTFKPTAAQSCSSPVATASPSFIVCRSAVANRMQYPSSEFLVRTRLRAPSASCLTPSLQMGIPSP